MEKLISEASNSKHFFEETLLSLRINIERIVNGREYYEEEHVQPIINQYYKDIDFNTIDKNQLFTQLNELVTNTHDEHLPYNSTTRNYLYTWADLQIDGNLKSIYSGQEKKAEQIIKEDYEADLRRLEAYEKLKNASDARLKMSLIENENMYNCEHVVPQSWFNKDSPMRGDMHHLFTCEKVCNSLRSNHPFYDFIDYTPTLGTKIIKTECGKYEENKFEPESGKGTVARATLYFLLRYPGEIMQYNSEDIELLLKWHNEYKVCIYEKHRNQAIFDLQKNRNPLIDFPQYADRVNFELGIR